jgi:hypothetical protein
MNQSPESSIGKGGSGSGSLQRQETISKATHGAADMTRRMVCGGLAGMIAKV